jgi:hypothetical protein
MGGEEGAWVVIRLGLSDTQLSPAILLISRAI